MSDKKNLSRRSFLKGAGTAVALGGVGVATSAAGLALLGDEQKALAQEQAVWPFPYETLDPEVVRVRGHANYYQGECCYGAFSAVLETMREVIGGQYNNVPSEIMFFGGGGIAGWGTTCGALIGSCSAMTLAAPSKDAAKGLANALLGWYSTTALPSDVANQYAVDGLYEAEPRAEGELAQSVSASPLCHASVTNWCQASGFASHSPQRAERCARLVGDTAAKAVELLNAHLTEGTPIEPGYTFSDEALGCMSCHFMGEDYDAGQFTQGRGECTTCHDDAHADSDD